MSDTITIDREELNAMVRGLVVDAMNVGAEAGTIRAAAGAPPADEVVESMLPVERDLRALRALLHPDEPADAGLIERVDGLIAYAELVIKGRGTPVRLRVLDTGGAVGTKHVEECPVCQGVVDPEIGVKGADGRLYHPAHADEAPRVVSDRPVIL